MVGRSGTVGPIRPLHSPCFPVFCRGHYVPYIKAHRPGKRRSSAPSVLVNSMRESSFQVRPQIERSDFFSHALGGHMSRRCSIVSLVTRIPQLVYLKLQTTPADPIPFGSLCVECSRFPSGGEPSSPAEPVGRFLLGANVLGRDSHQSSAWRPSSLRKPFRIRGCATYEVSVWIFF